MGKKDGKPCIRCGTSAWRKDGTCKKCQAIKTKKWTEEKKQYYKDNPKDEICTECGDNNWSLVGRCNSCAKIRRQKKIAKNKKNGIDKQCDICGNNDWYLDGRCKNCVKRQRTELKERRKQNPKDEICERCGENDWSLTGRCIPCSRKRISKYKEDNYDLVLKRNRKYQRLNKEMVNKRRRDRYKQDEQYKQTVINMGKTWRYNNASYFIEYGIRNRKELSHKARVWRKNNPDKVSVQRHKRRAKKSKNGGYHTVNEWSKLYELFNKCCLHPDCLNKHLEYPKHGDNSIHKDHVISIKNGGTSNINNYQPLCQYHNLSKHSKNIDYRPYAIQHLGLFEKIINENLTYLFPDEYFI